MKFLNDMQIRALKPQPQKYYRSVGDGVLVCVYPSGYKTLFLDCVKNGRRCKLKLGAYPNLTIKEAKAKANSVKDELDGLFKNAKFIDVCKMFFDVKFKNSTIKHKQRNFRYFERLFLPKLANLPLKKISRTQILECLQKYIDNKNYDSFARALSNVNAMYKFATSYGYAEHNIVADIDIRAILPRYEKKHYPTLTKEHDIKMLLKNICEYNGSLRVKMCALFGILTALRSINCRFATWEQIDLCSGIMLIEAKDMKNRQPFTVSLSTQLTDLLDRYRSIDVVVSSSEYLFPSLKSLKIPLSDNTVRVMLRNLGYDKFTLTTHGFRSMFSTIAHEMREAHGTHSDIIECCLAHNEKDRIKAAYNHATNKTQKAKLWQWWSDYLQGLYDYTTII